MQRWSPRVAIEALLSQRMGSKPGILHKNVLWTMTAIQRKARGTAYCQRDCEYRETRVRAGYNWSASWAEAPVSHHSSRDTTQGRAAASGGDRGHVAVDFTAVAEHRNIGNSVLCDGSGVPVGQLVGAPRIVRRTSGVQQIASAEVDSPHDILASPQSNRQPAQKR